MNRTSLDIIVFPCACLYFILGLPLQLIIANERDSRSKPNILFIVVDDLGWNDVACQGNTRIKTPAIDQLANRGTRFTAAYSASCVCSPTRAALITGVSPARLHITQHGKDGPAFWPADRLVQPPQAEHVLPLESTTIAERLKEVGYATGFFGKWHLSGDQDRNATRGNESDFWPEHQGFDVNIGGCGFGGPPTYFDPYKIPSIKPRKTGEYLTDRLAEEAIGFIQHHHKQPMFICLWTYNVHYPFEAPKDLIEKYKSHEGPGLKNPVFAAQVEATDRAIGRVLEELEKLHLDINTLVIFTSDNGGWDGASDNRPLRAGKGFLYEGGLRVPLIIRWPMHAETSPRTIDAPVISMDLPATILDAAQVKIENETKLDGVSLRPLFQGENLSRESIYFHYPHFAFHRANRPGAAIRSGKYKLIRNFDDASLELYDLLEDESESHNLSLKLPNVSSRLNRKLDDWLKRQAAQLPTPAK